MIFSNLVICLWLLCVRLDQVNSYMSDNESCGDSVSSRGFRGDANYYTGADDKVGCLIYVTYFSFTPLFSSSEDSSVHCGKWPMRGHWRHRTVAADGRETGGGETLLLFCFCLHF